MEKKDIKILVADDMQMMRAIILSILQNLGYKNLVTSNNGVDAYDKLRDGDFHLAILDWRMPKLDGLGLLKKVRSDKGLKELPVLMLTAKSEKEKIQEALEAGANDYVVKPFTANILKEKIDAILLTSLNISD